MKQLRKVYFEVNRRFAPGDEVLFDEKTPSALAFVRAELAWSAKDVRDRLLPQAKGLPMLSDRHRAFLDALAKGLDEAVSARRISYRDYLNLEVYWSRADLLVKVFDPAFRKHYPGGTEELDPSGVEIAPEWKFDPTLSSANGLERLTSRGVFPTRKKRLEEEVLGRAPRFLIYTTHRIEEIQFEETYDLFLAPWGKFTEPMYAYPFVRPDGESALGHDSNHSIWYAKALIGALDRSKGRADLERTVAERGRFKRALDRFIRTEPDPSLQSIFRYYRHCLVHEGQYEHDTDVFSAKGLLENWAMRMSYAGPSNRENRVFFEAGVPRREKFEEADLELKAFLERLAKTA
jgi:hypothetical protein